MKKRPKDDGTTATISVNGGPEIPFTTPEEIAAAGPAIRDGLRALQPQPKGRPMRTERLPVALTDDEVRVRGEELAGIVREIDDAEEAKRQAAAEAKEELDALWARAGKLGAEIREKRVDRDEEVREEVDGTRRIVTLYRLDTGEVVRERAANSSDLQTAFPALAAVHDIAEGGKPPKA